MAKKQVVVNALFCDQGMGTLVRVYNDDDKLTNLALFDLGSKSGLDRGAGRAVKFVIAALSEMVKDGVTPAIDLVVVSHGDHDHWNLLPVLQQNIVVDPELKATKVDKMVYGGGAWAEESKDALDEFAKALKTTANALPIDESSYSKAGKVPSKFYKIDDVQFYLLASTVEIPGGGKSAERNGGSAVVAMHFGGNTAIVPGDATADTIGWINHYIFDQWAAHKPSMNPIKPCHVLAVPHHGARRTISDEYVPKKRKLDPDAEFSIAETFAKYVRPLNIVASAGYLSQYKHPARSTMVQLALAVTDSAPIHDFVWFDDTVIGKVYKGWKAITDDQRGIYTTVQSLADPPKRGEPKFTMTATGEVFFSFDWIEAEIIPPYERFDQYAATPHER